MSNSNEPIPIRLPCPSCHELHIDEGEFATKPHHTHSCQHCGHTWRPAVACTVGVQFLPGFVNAKGDAPNDGLLRKMAPHTFDPMAATLRDDLAMAALTGLLASNSGSGSCYSEESVAATARGAYLFADEMIRQRDEHPLDVLNRKPSG